MREYFKERRYRPKKRLGQNFLIDCHVARFIAERIEFGTVYEIGCGIGNLTQFLAEKADFVIGIDIELDFLDYFRTKKHRTNVELVNGDVLTFKLSRKIDYVVSNTPYSISSDIIVKLCKEVDFGEGILMFQEDFAKRLLASPGAQNYGRISVISKICFSIKPLLTVNPQSFIPRPEVRSKIILVKKNNIMVEKVMNVERLTQKIFSYRRKKLWFALVKGLKVKKEDVSFLGDLLHKRVFELSPSEIIALTEKLNERGLL